MSNDTKLYTISNSEAPWGLHVHFTKEISKLSTNPRGKLVHGARFETSLSLFRRGWWAAPGPRAHADGWCSDFCLHRHLSFHSSITACANESCFESTSDLCFLIQLGAGCLWGFVFESQYNYYREVFGKLCSQQR